MGKRGPAPRPTNLKLLHGESRPCRVNYDEPIAGDGPVRVPEFLTVEAKAIWDELAPDLMRAGVLTAWDTHQFAIYCDAVARYEEASRVVAELGIIIEGRRDMAVKNPAMQLLRDTANIVRAYAQEFGLTPSSRSGISIDREEQRGGAERLLS